MRSGNATSTEIIGVTDPIKVSWKEEKETGRSCRGHLEVIQVVCYPVYMFLLENLQDSIQSIKIDFLIFKNHAVSDGIATAFWMFLTVLECWNVHSSWKSEVEFLERFVG